MEEHRKLRRVGLVLREMQGGLARGQSTVGMAAGGVAVDDCAARPPVITSAFLKGLLLLLSQPDRDPVHLAGMQTMPPGHDRRFRCIFGDPEHAAELLRAALRRLGSGLGPLFGWLSAFVGWPGSSSACTVFSPG